MLNNFSRKQTCNSITTTAKRFWQQSITKKESVGFASKFSKDRGNLPLLVSNIAGGSFVLIFAGRKYVIMFFSFFFFLPFFHLFDLFYIFFVLFLHLILHPTSPSPPPIEFFSIPMS
jgi:hypothetical protein